MLAAAQGEHHVLGLRMVADVLEGAGFDVLYLGPDVPLAARLAACRAHDPVVLALRVTMPLNVPALIREIEAVCALDRPPAILVAGRASPLLFEKGPGVPTVLGPEDVVSVVEHLIAHPPTGVVVPAALALLVPPEMPTDGVGTEAARSIEHGFSQTALRLPRLPASRRHRTPRRSRPSGSLTSSTSEGSRPNASRVISTLRPKSRRPPSTHPG